MSCSNNNINTYLKDATIKSLNYMNTHYSNIYQNPPNDYYQYSSDANDPFKPSFKGQYSNTIQTNLNIDFTTEDDIIHSNLKYITINTDDNSYVNCAVQTSVPWFTMSEDYKKCEIVKNIEYDDTRLKIEKIKDDTVVSPVLSSKNKNKTAFCAYFSNVNKAYCENAWYDWMITPNYHLGNTYYKDNSQYSELDVYKCYKPCSGDFIPYTTEKGEIKCIPKKYFGSGIFSRKYMYNSIVLINLIGNIACDTNENGHIYKDYFRTNLLYILHRLIYEYEISNKVDKDIYEINSDIQNKIKLNPIRPESQSDEAKKYTDKQNNFQKIRSEYNDIYKNIKKVLEDDVLKNYDSNNNKDYLNLNEFTYKNGRFHENEPEMFSYTGMETYGVLTPPILIHTWMLSQIFKPLERDIFNYRDDFYNSLEDNINKIKKETLYYKLNKIFNDKHKAIRLKNIFFKAITNCYDGKTAFSVNFISATKKALNNSELLKIIKDNKFYYFTNNINFIKSLNPIPLPANTYPTGKNRIDYLINIVSDDLKPTLIDLVRSINIDTNKEYGQMKENFNLLLICDDTNITNLIQSLKYYKDTDLNILYSELLKNAKTFSESSNSYKYALKYFEGNDPNDFNKIPADLYCHYLFSIEELETKSCQPGYVYNPTVKECEKIAELPPPPPENKSEMDDEDINIPNLKSIMRIFLQIIIVVVILYLIYIVYDMFGEFILSTINYILVNFNHIKQDANFKLMDFFSGTNISDKLDVESKKLNSKIELAQSELDNIIRKDKLAIQYNEEVKYREIQKAKAKASE